MAKISFRLWWLIVAIVVMLIPVLLTIFIVLPLSPSP